MADRRYRPGHRNSPQLRGDGKMSEERYAWLKTAVGQMVILVQHGEGKETGPTIRLHLPRPGGRPISYNLTALTKEELDEMRKFFELLFATAEPVVISRDRMAQDALTAGDDSFARVYRQLPQFIVREGSQPRYDQGVHDGSEGLPPGSGGDSDPSEGSGVVCGELADGEPEEDSPQDDGPETHKPPSLRQVGGAGTDPA